MLSNRLEFVLFAKNDGKLLATNFHQLSQFGFPVRAFVDSTSNLNEVAHLEAANVDFQMIDNKHGFAEGMLPGILANVVSEWVFLLNVDEWPSQELVDRVELAITQADQHINVIGVSRKWVRFGVRGELQLSRLPRLLLGDYQWRVIRPRQIELNTVIHTAGVVVDRNRSLKLGLRAPLYHLDWIVHSPHERKKKLSFYEQMREGYYTRFRDYYLPEEREWIHFFKRLDDAALESVARAFFESKGGQTWI